MKKIKQMLMTVAVLLCSATAHAYDFEVDGIYYKILSATDLTVNVVSGENPYSGEVVIPSTVVYKSKTLTVTEISGFFNCTELTSITIPNSITTISQSAFYGCTSLTSVTIPSSVVGIGEEAFANCTQLKDLCIEDGESTLSFLWDGWNNGSKVFSSCPLENIYLGRKLSFKGGNVNNSPFKYIRKLKTLTIGNGVTSISAWMFEGCENLTNVTIGSSITNIDGSAFSYCDSLSNIYLMCATPPTVEANNFTESQHVNAMVYVPQGTLAAYQAADGWKGFWNIQEHDIPVEVEKCATPTISYENGKLTITSETEGAEFVTEITNSDITKHYGSAIELAVTYNISSYAKSEGYANSDIANVTLCWLEGGNGSDIIQIKSTPVLIKSNEGSISISGVKSDTEITVYNIYGSRVATAVADGNEVVISTSLNKNDTAIIHIGDKVIKIVIR